jgi:hypothetical protein
MAVGRGGVDPDRLPQIQDRFFNKRLSRSGVTQSGDAGIEVGFPKFVKDEVVQGTKLDRPLQGLDPCLYIRFFFGSIIEVIIPVNKNIQNRYENSGINQAYFF